MSLVKTNAAQIGQSLTATNNFTMYQPASPDGTVRWGVGNSGSVTDIVTLNSSGNVGIGTSSPASKTDISYSDSSRNTLLTLTNTNTGGYGPWINFYGGYSGGYSFAKIGAENDNGTGGSMRFHTADTSKVSQERMRIDSSGNVGIGQTPTAYGSTVRNVESYIAGASGYTLVSAATASVKTEISASESSLLGQVGTRTNHPLVVKTNDTERMRIDSSGNLLVGTTTSGGVGGLTVTPNGQGANTPAILGFNKSASGTYYAQQFKYNGTIVGDIEYSNTATAYVTTSDHRLKENVQPMQNALDTVAQLNPVTYTWKADGSDGQGFIAHELQAVVPDCVTGEKDAVDADGNPVYQGIDTSFLVATLTKAIQELTARIEQLEAK